MTHFVHAFSLLAILVICQAIGDSHDVFELTEDNFDYTATGTWLVEFYAPWCGICKKLGPVYAEAAAEARGSSLKFAKVDGTIQTGLKKKFDVKGFPVIYFFRNGEHRNYKGGRKLEDFIAFAEEMDKPPTSQLTFSQTKKITNFRDHPVSFLFSGKRGLEQNVYVSVATQLQGMYQFFTTIDGKLMAQYGLSDHIPQLVAISEGGDDHTFSGPWDDQEALREFIDQHRLPHLSWLTPSTFSEITKSKKLIVYIFVDLIMSDLLDYRQMLIQVAKEYPQLAFAMIDAAKFEKYAHQYKLDLARLPHLLGFDYDAEHYFSMTNEESFEYSDFQDSSKIKSFLDRVAAGEVEYTPVLKWYQPSRWWRKMQKFMNTLSETEMWLCTIGLGLVFVVTTFGGLYFVEKSVAGAPVPVRQKKD